MKWSVLDGILFFGLPSLRIPWLEWSTYTTIACFMAHAVVNAMLMFQVGLPIEAWLVAIGKLVWDREIAIAEHSVKAASLIQNSSLILGKQIINILPEGSANLNPESSPFCLDSSQTTIHIPMFVNQTVPTFIELLRSDFETNTLESVIFTAKEVRNLRKEADRGFAKVDKTSPRLWKIPVKRTGLYRLGRVLDESKLEVQGTHSDALVVQCPSASIKAGTQHRCTGELSNFFIDVDATPPLKISYTRTINRGEDTSVSLTWHPEDLESPLQGRGKSQSMIQAGTELTEVSWAQNRKHQISINETMDIGGGWQYHIDKIQDGCGNVAHYARKDEDKKPRSGRSSHLEQDFVVHERPRVRLSDCTAQKPKRVAKGKSSTLGVSLNPLGHHDTKGTQHHLTYDFAPLSEDGHSHDMTLARKETFVIAGSSNGPSISEPGVYSLLSVATDYCSGDVLEPSSCLLMNPPEPDAMITYEEIPDKCAGNSVGIQVNLDLTGSPPFIIRYTEQRKGGPSRQRSARIDSLRHQLIFEPKEAGHYTYDFLDISDSVYPKPHSLAHQGFKLEQDIKPTAWAHFSEHSPRKSACLDQATAFDVILSGEGPWNLEYDLVHGRSRKKVHAKNLTSEVFKLETPKLERGGTYSITLSSVTDTSGCRIFLDEEAKIEVRQQKPSVAFGHIDGSRSIRALQNQKVRLPVRLSGEKPWSLSLANSVTNEIRNVKIDSSNSHVEVSGEGSWVLQAVSDAGCPGIIDKSAATFDVQWIAQPAVSLASSSKISAQGAKHIKSAVCEGEQDSFEILLSGNAPYQVKYEVHEFPDQSAATTQSRKENYASNSASVRMHTSRSGLYKYVVADVSDRFYDLGHRKRLSAIVVEQQVNPRPNAVFSNAGKTYSYCKEDDSGNEVIPVVLTGKPPFTLEIGIKHQTISKPETITISDIPTNKYNIQVPRSSLGLGGYSVGIIRVLDGHGCQRVKERADRDNIHVNVVDVPTITPMEVKTDYCVGDRIAYSLSGTAPFNVFYTFEGMKKQAAVSNTDFRRLAEKPGVFTINAVSDRASTDACRARTNITKVVHELPSVRISKGKTQEVDIHEGGETQIVFEFGGSPPFEFT